MIKRAILLLQLILVVTIVNGKESKKDRNQVDSLDKYIYITLLDEIYVGNWLNRFKMGHVEREINKKKFIFAGEKIAGITATHYSLSGDNADYLLLLDGITANGSMPF
ncbi:MAG: hypothetical protein SNG45_02085 [Rikenellaceae bacterium]